VRWENLILDGAAPPDRPVDPQLPLGLPGAVVRTFDTPGFAGMTFYEVRAKSAINRVPAASRVPFEWTINPYRGCSHACTYCLTGDTPILMADGHTKPLAEVRVGDALYGTARRGDHRSDGESGPRSGRSSESSRASTGPHELLMQSLKHFGHRNTSCDRTYPLRVIGCPSAAAAAAFQSPTNYSNCSETRDLASRGRDSTGNSVRTEFDQPEKSRRSRTTGNPCVPNNWYDSYWLWARQRS